MICEVDGRERVEQDIEMIGEMTVIHDEQNVQFGLTGEFDSFHFRPVEPTWEWPLDARSPHEPPGTPTLFDELDVPAQPK